VPVAGCGGGRLCEPSANQRGKDGFFRGQLGRFYRIAIANSDSEAEQFISQEKVTI